MRGAATFLPQFKTFAQKVSLRLLCDHYHIRVEDAELPVLFDQLHRKANWLEFPSLMEALDICAPDILPNLNKLLQFIFTTSYLPVKGFHITLSNGVLCISRIGQIEMSC